MKKLAIIGFGGHVTKNILPALKKIDGIGIEAIYVRNVEKYVHLIDEHDIELRSLSEFPDSVAEWCYIATPISTHYELTKRALLLNKNVICEKPLTDSSQYSQELVELAQSRGLVLHEVCVYKFHSQYQYLVQLVEENKQNIKSISAKFTIPHLPKDDIRYKREMSGGALLDVGYYPLSIMVNLLGNPEKVQATKKSEVGYDVDLSGVAILDYKNFYAVAEWGIGLPYSNELVLVTNDKKYFFNRVFSKPATLNTTVDIFEGFSHTVYETGRDDQFVNMFKSFIFKGLDSRDARAVCSWVGQILESV
ncbi:Gfo/Idh/MocA family protein [Teredinibacter haidensis]|uniref:Gfo/Idh/MocA family protein n=1 Tax=Teredinibacter haidensis TaxID=2731755 RepID=UPI000948AB16|nr:Gfo/Idh/MocA family oxidoreductase [Teredinibacter haidensis]